jgi:hypothetical protein
VVRIAVRNQIGQQIEDLYRLQGVEHAGRHVRGLRQGALSDVCLAEGNRRFICRQRSKNNLSVILAFDAARDNFAGFRFDLCRRIAFGNDF